MIQPPDTGTARYVGTKRAGIVCIRVSYWTATTDRSGASPSETRASLAETASVDRRELDLRIANGARRFRADETTWCAIGWVCVNVVTVYEVGRKRTAAVSGLL
jgi:hypothetical protein